MEAEILLSRLCARHGVDPASGARLLPLVRWALEAPRDSRERILRVVEDQLQGKPRKADQPSAAGELQAAAEHAVLVAVARVLHQWKPDQGLLDLGQGAGGGGEVEDGAA